MNFSANAGIGLESARKFAAFHANVTLACRDAAKGEVARLDIVASTGNENVLVRVLDVSSFASVRSFAKADWRTFAKSPPSEVLAPASGLPSSRSWRKTQNFLDFSIEEKLTLLFSLPPAPTEAGTSLDRRWRLRTPRRWTRVSVRSFGMRGSQRSELPALFSKYLSVVLSVLVPNWVCRDLQLTRRPRRPRSRLRTAAAAEGKPTLAALNLVPRAAIHPPSLCQPRLILPLPRLIPSSRPRPNSNLSATLSSTTSALSCPGTPSNVRAKGKPHRDCPTAALVATAKALQSGTLDAILRLVKAGLHV